MVGNPLSDILIRVKNGYLAGQKTVEAPYSKAKEELVRILLKEGYLAKIEIGKTRTSSQKKSMEIKILRLQLKYVGRKPALERVKIISRPSLKIYVKKEKIPQVLGSQGLVILSTPQGLMTGQKARQKGLGGEVIAEIW